MVEQRWLQEAVLVLATEHIRSKNRKYIGLQEILKPLIWFVDCKEKALL